MLMAMKIQGHFSIIWFEVGEKSIWFKNKNLRFQDFKIPHKVQSNWLHEYILNTAK